MSILLSCGSTAGVSAATWRSTGALPAPHYRPAVVALEDGRVAVIGGKGPDTDQRAGAPMADVSLFDPETNKWSQAQPMTTPRYQAAAVRLTDGRLMVTGGLGPDWKPLANVEIYDPGSDRWTLTGDLLAPRESHAAVVLATGEVLVTAGYDTDKEALGSTERWSAADGRWRQAAALPAPRSLTSFFTTDPSGAAHLFDGVEGDDVYAVASWDPAADRWTEGPEAPVPRSGASFVRLTDGRVLRLAGTGRLHALGDVFDPRTRAWTVHTDRPSEDREYAGAAPLADGRVLLASGGVVRESTCSASALVVDPSTGRFEPTASLPAPRSHALAMSLPDGRVLLVGGWSCGPPAQALHDALLYVPAR